MGTQKIRHFENGIDCRWRYRLFPTDEQIAWFNTQFSGMRYIYNQILAFAYWKYEKTGKNCLLEWSFATFKKENPDNSFARELLASAVGYEKIAVTSAFSNWFRRLQQKKKNGTKDVIRKPQFKSAKRDRNSFTFQTPGTTNSSATGTLVLDWENDRVKLPKIGYVKARLHRAFEGYCSSATVYEDNGDYYISLVLELPAPELLPKTGKVVGVDMGKRTNLLIPSEGEPYPNKKFGKKAQRKLRRLNKKLARQQRVLVPEDELTEYEKSLGKPIYRDSKSRATTRRRKQKLESHIKHQRADYQHKIALDLVRRFDVIGVEHLNIKGMISNGKKSKEAINGTDTKEKVLS